MEFRKVFDTIPDQFDKYRSRYSTELFAELIAYAEVGPGKTVLELGPGTGQATDPILETGCEYHAIELGEHLFEMMKRKYGGFPYTNATKYGYIGFEEREYYGTREFTADEYVAFSGTHCDHIVIAEPYKSPFFEGLREAILEAGNKIETKETYILYLAKKPL